MAPVKTSVCSDCKKDIEYAGLGLWKHVKPPKRNRQHRALPRRWFRLVRGD